MGRGKRREPLFSLPPSHRTPRSLFLSPQPPHNTKRPLGRREPSGKFLIFRCPEMAKTTDPLIKV